MNLFNGAGDRNRTCDLLITNELLYRLSYTGLSSILQEHTAQIDTLKPQHWTQNS